MTLSVMPAGAGIQVARVKVPVGDESVWTPAFAGVTSGLIAAIAGRMPS